MGKAILHLQIANFKFSHTFITCNRLLETNILFGINLQKRYSLSYCWDADRQLFMQKESSFLTYTRNEDHHNITEVKYIPKLPPRHNGTIPIKIKGHDLRDQLAYIISNQCTKKRDLTQTSMTVSITLKANQHYTLLL